MYWTAKFQHTAARRRLGENREIVNLKQRVSTHSRPKAAGFRNVWTDCPICGFNTQPPEGGWV